MKPKTSNHSGRIWGIVPTQIQLRITEGTQQRKGKQQTTRENERHKHEGGTTTTKTANKATHTRSSTHPPPEGEWSFMWGGRPRHERRTNNQQQRGEQEDPQRGETDCTLQTSEKTQNKQNYRKNKNHQEKTRLPSTALLAHRTLVKTVLILECRVSLELLSQPVDDAAVAARLVRMNVR